MDVKRESAGVSARLLSMLYDNQMKYSIFDKINNKAIIQT